MQVLCHRSNLAGIDRAKENTLQAARSCLDRGWGIETDIRRSSNGLFYISHDQAELTEENDADAFCALFRCFPGATIALNIKELGYESDLLEYLSEQQVGQQIFLFDMELLEEHTGQTASLFRRLDPEIRLAARVSDHDETIAGALSVTPADTIWLDEFDHLWVAESDIKCLKDAGKTIHAVSPEVHGFSMAEMQRRWREFYRWGVDGICTDHPVLLARSLLLEMG